MLGIRVGKKPQQQIQGMTSQSFESLAGTEWVNTGQGNPDFQV